MEIKDFIEKAIEGGWERTGERDELYLLPEQPHDRDTRLGLRPNRFAVLLDPAAWKAVGKVEGWGHKGDGYDGPNMVPSADWKENMHRMIDALAEGKSIEDYLNTL